MVAMDDWNYARGMLAALLASLLLWEASPACILLLYDV